MSQESERRKINEGWIRTLRARLDMNQQEFSDRLGVDRSSVARWELDSNRPTRLAAMALLGLAAGSFQKPEVAEISTRKIRALGNDDDLLTAKELSSFAKISMTKIYIDTNAGRMPCYRWGQKRAGKNPQYRFMKSEILAWLKNECRISPNTSNV